MECLPQAKYDSWGHYVGFTFATIPNLLSSLLPSTAFTPCARLIARIDLERETLMTTDQIAMGWRLRRNPNMGNKIRERSEDRLP